MKSTRDSLADKVSPDMTNQDALRSLCRARVQAAARVRKWLNFSLFCSTSECEFWLCRPMVRFNYGNYHDNSGNSTCGPRSDVRGSDARNTEGWAKERNSTR